MALGGRRSGQARWTSAKESLYGSSEMVSGVAYPRDIHMRTASQTRPFHYTICAADVAKGRFASGGGSTVACIIVALSEECFLRCRQCRFRLCGNGIQPYVSSCPDYLKRCEVFGCMKSGRCIEFTVPFISI